MSLVQHLVSPRLPTTLAGRASVDIPGYDIFDYIPETVWVLPTKLDVTRFEEALSSALQVYPHAAGQLRCSDGRWFIELTNTPVPVDIDYKPSATSDTFLNGDWVIQDDLSPFTNNQHTSARSVNDGNPLLRLKLTFLGNETCIGVSWHHVLGDAMVALRFMHTLSQFFQGLPQEYPSPTFEKYHFPKPSPALLAEFWPHIPHLRVTLPLSEFGELFGEFLRSFEDLKWRITHHDLAGLRSTLSSRQPTESVLSQQDCLTAYVVAVLNHNTSAPMPTVMNFTSFRDIRAPFIAEDVAGNLVQFVHAAVPTDMAGIATALRRALVQCRNPDYVHDLMSVASERMLETVNAGKGFDVFQGDPVVFVNSNTAVDWRSAHFGCPDGTRFYLNGMAKYYLRCFRSNPVKGNDGVWRARQSVDISMGVAKELKPRLLETFARGIQYMLKNERARL